MSEDYIPENYVQLSSIGAKITIESAQAIFETVLEIYNQRNHPAVDALRKEIRDHVEIPGFRRGKTTDKAPIYQIRRALENRWFEKPPLCDAVLNVWSGLKKELIQICQNYLELKIDQIHSYQKNQLNGALEENGISLPEFLHNMAHQIINEYNDIGTLDQIEVGLFIGMKTIALRDMESMEQQTKNANQTLSQAWKDLLAELEQVPEEDKRWETTEEFIQALQKLSRNKLEGREDKSKIKKLEKLIADNLLLIQKWERYLTVEICNDWSIVNIQSEKLDDVIKHIEHFLGLSNSYEKLKQQEPSTRLERADIDKKINEYEDQIIAIFEQLKTIFQIPREKETTTNKGKDNEPHEPPENISVIQVEDDIIKALVEDQQPKEDNNKSGNILPDIASTFQEKSSEKVDQQEEIENNILDKYNQKIYEYLQKRDLLKAYWLCWGLEKQNINGKIPSWLIAALQGMIWLIKLWPEQPKEFLDTFHNVVMPNQRTLDFEDEFQCYLGSVVGSLMSMIAPGRGWETLYDVPISHKSDSLNNFFALVRDANHKGLMLDPVMVQIIVNKEQTEDRIHQISQQARDWLEKGKNRSAFPPLRAQNVWQDLVHTQHGELYKFLYPISIDQRKHLQEVEKAIKKWRDRSEVDKTIQRIDRKITNNKNKRPIEGEARDRIISWIQDACDIAENWGKFVKESVLSNEKGKNWQFDQTKEFCEKASQLLDKTISELKIPEKENYPISTKVIWQLLLFILKGFYAIITPHEQTHKEDYIPLPLNIECLGRWDRYHFEHNLITSLLDFPELSLDDLGYLEQNQFSTLVDILVTTSDRKIDEIIEKWIQSHDYRFIDYLLCKVADHDLWEDRIQEAFRSDMQRLEQVEIEETIVMIEQALLDGLISEVEYTEYKSQVESIRKPIQQKNFNEIQYISVKRKSCQLEEIRKKLTDRREERLLKLQEHWKEVKGQLPSITLGDQQHADLITNVVENSIKEKNLRVSGEYLSHLDAVLNGTQNLSKPLFEIRTQDEKDILQEFQTTLQILYDAFIKHNNLRRITELIENEQPIGSFTFPPNFPRPRLKEAAKAFDAWRKLKEGADNDAKINIQTIIEYLGFTFTIQTPVREVPMSDLATKFTHWQINASVKDLSPVAQFGSLRNEQYDVIGVWERPGIDVISSQISSLMKKTGNKPTILLYFGRLASKMRENLFSITHRENLPMIIIDETLMLFLTRQRDSRLRPTFLCTLPYASVNPYFPAAAGRVPPEIFMGRRDMVERLIDPYGPAIVYGGRQLGKSALLRMVEREFHHPKEGQFAVYEDIRPVGNQLSGKNYKEELNDILIKSLKNAKFPIDTRNASNFDRLIDSLYQTIMDQKLKMILMLDEADSFLDADAEKNFELVQKFKNLMDKSGRRFKIVLAGLHNVQRFQRISNQPLAHLSTIEIGPLDPESACKLLMEPMHAIGYRYGETDKEEDISLVLHILSYTNYHPGLIQVFGNHLVEHLRKNYQKPTSLPLPILRNDIEAVYRNKEVRDTIRDRFNWTLALDPRYEVIVLALIIEQWDDLNGFDRCYTARELREIASIYWEKAFENEGTFRGFLDELRGLGVLTVIDGSKYRLRSPNLVYLLGTYQEINDRLESIVDNPPPGEQALESNRVQLETGSYSPLTFKQEQVLNSSQSNVALIFGTPAAGLQLIDQAVQRLKPERGVYKEIRIAAQNGAAIKQQLKQLVSENSQAGKIIALRETTGNSEEIREQVLTAVEYCSKLARGLKIYFVMDAQAAWQWHEMPNKSRLELEDQIDIILLERWKKLGIKQRIEMRLWNGNEVQPTENLLKKILETTNGWYFLLDEFFNNYFDGKDPLLSIETFDKNLYSSGSILAQNFIKAISIFDDIPKRVIGAFLDEELAKSIQSEEQPAEYLYNFKLPNVSIEKIENAINYLKKLQVLYPDNTLDPVITRLWKHA